MTTDPHLQIREMIVEVDHPGSEYKAKVAGLPLRFLSTPGGVQSRAPLLGEHTQEVLDEVRARVNTVSA